METITIDDVEYINVDILKTKVPAYYTGCRNGRELIQKKKIPKAKYIFGRDTDEGWEESDGRSNKYDRVLIRLDYVKSIKDLWNELNGNGDVKPVPQTIELEDDEMFRDNEGNVYDVETVGERKHDGIYFRVYDIADVFELPNLRTCILRDRSGFSQCDDYMFFMCPSENNCHVKTKRLFLTYIGFLRVLLTSRAGIAKKFIGWATETLFIAHLGTRDQKEKLVGKLMGVTSKVVKEVFSKTSMKMPCIYLMSLGSVYDLRNTFNIPESFSDNSIVYKHGMSRNLERRMSEHEKSYGKMENVEIQLEAYEYVDPQYMSEAETSMTSYFSVSGMTLKHEKYIELVIITKQNLVSVKKQIGTVSRAYMGHVTELITKLKDSQNEIKLLEKEVDMLKKEIDHLKETKQLEMRLMEKKLKLAKLKHE